MEEKRLREYSLNAMLVRKTISGRGQRYESRESKKNVAAEHTHVSPRGTHTVYSCGRGWGCVHARAGKQDIRATVIVDGCDELEIYSLSCNPAKQQEFFRALNYSF